MLLGGAEVQQDLHVAGVRRIAVADLARDQRAPHALGERRVLDVGETGAVALVWEEEVPQTRRPRLLLELVDRPAARPTGSSPREQLAVVGLLARRDLALR